MTIRKLTVADARNVKSIKLPQKGEALERRRGEWALLKALDLTLPELGAKTLDEVSALVMEAAGVEGVEIEPVTIGDEIAGVPWNDAQNLDERRQIEDRLAEIYRAHFADDEDDRPAPKARRLRIEYAARQAPIVVYLDHAPVIDGVRLDRVEIQPASYGTRAAVRAGTISRIDMVAEQTGIAADVIDALRFPDDERVLGAALILANEA